MLRFIKNRDMFATTVQLTYKGQKKFSTLLGGTCTILFVLALLVLFPWKLYQEVYHPYYYGTQ